MMRWSKKTDFLSIRYPLMAFLIFLCFIQLMPQVFITSSQMDTQLPPSADNDIYFWMQLVAYVFIALIVCFYFEETFRTPSAHYIGTFKLGTFRTVFLRYVRLLFIMEIIYLPFVYICIFRANKNIRYNMEFFGSVFELIDPLKPIFQCSVFMLFAVTSAMFFMALLKNKVYVIVLTLVICIMEIRAFPILFDKYTLFRGATMPRADYFSFFPENVLSLFVLSFIFLMLTLILHRFNKT